MKRFVILILFTIFSFFSIFTSTASAQSRRSAKWNTEASDRLYNKFKYADNRHSLLLTMGEPVVDYAVFYDVDTATVLPAQFMPLMVRGTNFELVNREQVMRMFAEDGELIVPHDRKYYQLAVAKGSEPEGELKERVGVLQSMLDSISPDMRMPIGCDIPFAHRHTQMEDIYYINNVSAEVKDGVFSLRYEGTSVELWDPASGERYSLTANYDDPGRTNVHITLNPSQAFFIIVRHYGDASAKIPMLPYATFNIPIVEKKYTQETPAVKPQPTPTVKPEKKPVQKPEPKPVQKPEKPVQKPVATPEKPKPTPSPVPAKAPTGFTKYWAIEFNMKLMHKPTETTRIQKRAFYIMRPPTLSDWTRNSDTRIRYYSGKAIYRNTFNTADAVRKEGTSGSAYWLSIEEAHDSVRVFVNGEEAGLLTHAPYEMNISRYVINGSNAIELHVSNNPENRMVGDLMLPETLRVLKEVSPTVTKATPLHPSGIVGNVILSVR